MSTPTISKHLLKRTISSRRQFLQLCGKLGLASGIASLTGLNSVRAATLGTSERVIFFYFPNGVVPDKYFADGVGTNFSLNYSMEPLEAFKDSLTLFKNLRLSGPEEDGHPNGAMRLLTGRTNGKGISLDKHLADAFAAQSTHSHIHLGIQSKKLVTNQHDIMISRIANGNEVSPEDNPIAANRSLFNGTSVIDIDEAQLAIFDNLQADLMELQALAGNDDATKLLQHAKAVEEIKQRTTAGTCTGFTITDFSDADVNNDKAVPTITKHQIDNMVQGMACGLSRVGTIQLSHHTGDCVMDWDYLAGTHDQSSHAASHNNTTIHSNQVRWYMDQVAYLLTQLQQRADPVRPGNMLDNSMVVVLSEISNGATHVKRPMPFFIAGKGGGAINTGRVLECNNASHADMLISVANAMGLSLSAFGDDSTGPLPGLLV